jgi:hypothetical protein
MYGSLAHSSFASSSGIKGDCQYVRVLTRATSEVTTELRTFSSNRLTFPFDPNSGEAIITTNIIGYGGACAKITFCVSFNGTTYTPDDGTVLHSRGFKTPNKNILPIGNNNGFTVRLNPKTPQSFCATFKITMVATEF